MAAENTPESDLGSIECFQNYTAPEVFIQGLAGIVDQQDVEAMIRAQKQMLQRFEKTNEMLTNCNALSVNRLKSAGTEFKKHTQLLLEMKKDLENIFKRMRVLKTKLANQYPEAFAAAEEQKIRVSKSEEEFSAEKDKMDSKPPTSITQPDLVKMGLQKSGECSSVADLGDPDPCSGDSGGISRPLKRGNSSSTDSPNGNSNNDSSPCTSDTG
ncbi:kxDL motif-containing protein CG10681 isoform X2 [Anabrus simplex]|uniref:kxDL motif-containing protein CG10681 isoform X2 n=1 Tax=Anabrus simplex TaxID=316456 RepID=UPI0034DD4BDA